MRTKKVESLVAKFQALTSEEQRQFLGLIDNDNTRFIQLVEFHEGDTEFINPADDDFDEDDEMRYYFMMIWNAFRDLCKERGEEWAKTHSWECDPEAGNAYDLAIVTL